VDGAEVISTLTDRAQEPVLSRANAIVNQVYVVSVNEAARNHRPQSRGGPEGEARLEAGENATDH
jgi:hypothetical protein